MPDPKTPAQHPVEPTEEQLRLADIAEILRTVDYDEDTLELKEDAGGLLSALEHALTGSAGCIEPEEWQASRKAALAKHADYIGFDRLYPELTTEHPAEPCPERSSE